MGACIHVGMCIFKREKYYDSVEVIQCIAKESFHNIKAVICTVESLTKSCKLVPMLNGEKSLLNMMQESSILLLVTKLGFMLQLATATEDLLR